MEKEMSNQVNINAEYRQEEGKSSNRLLRRSGSIPAVIYGGSNDPIKVSILEKDITKAALIPGFATQILSILIDGNSENVIVKEIQRHPASERVLHADLMRVNPDTKITLSVPIRFLNEETCVGVKLHGGAISRLINNIDINCLASNLPEYLEVDLENLDIGDSVFLSTLNLPEGVEIPSLALGDDRDQAVVSVAEAKVMEIETEIDEAAVEGEEGAEGEGEEGAEGLSEEQGSDSE